MVSSDHMTLTYSPSQLKSTNNKHYGSLIFLSGTACRMGDWLWTETVFLKPSRKKICLHRSEVNQYLMCPSVKDQETRGIRSQIPENISKTLGEPNFRRHSTGLSSLREIWVNTETVHPFNEDHCKVFSKLINRQSICLEICGWPGLIITLLHLSFRFTGRLFFVQCGKRKLLFLLV